MAVILHTGNFSYVANRPGTSTGAYGHHNSVYTEDDTDDTSTHQGAYDVLRRTSIADTHL